MLLFGFNHFHVDLLLRVPANKNKIVLLLNVGTVFSGGVTGLHVLTHLLRSATEHCLTNE